MTAKVIQANSGNYGSIQVTLLMPVEERVAGFGKAEKSKTNILEDDKL